LVSGDRAGWLSDGGDAACAHSQANRLAARSGLQFIGAAIGAGGAGSPRFLTSVWDFFALCSSKTGWATPLLLEARHDRSKTIGDGHGTSHRTRSHCIFNASTHILYDAA
jgi:hypothetical protein